MKKCNCNYDKEEIKRSIVEANKNIRYCYVKGPKGDKGDTGAATISIGNVETVDYSLPAEVINTGTNEDVILNFKIPKGEKGEKGETGPRGLPGEIGISEVITIDDVVTVDSSLDAFVQDDFDRNIHHLTFYIPKGERGEEGSKGDKGDPNGLTAYAERFSNSTQTFNVLANTKTIVPLETTGPIKEASYNSSYAIEIEKAGVYQINYFINLAFSENTNCIVQLEVNSIKIPGSDIKVAALANVISNISNSVIYDLAEYDEISLVITADKNTNLNFDGTTTAKLSALKLD